MELSVGINWDKKLLKTLVQLPDVKEIYGSCNSTIVGNGRPAFILGKTDVADMEAYISEVHSHGRKFNYTLNAPCLNNMEYTVSGHRKIIEQLDWLVSIGIDGVTVSIPYLLEIIKKRYPHIYVKVSIIAQVNTVQKAIYFENLGADEIMLDNMINRDFELLSQIKNSLNCKVSLLLNDACLFGCPYRYYHYNLCGHASQTDHESKGFYIDYCALRCTMDRLRNPSLTLSSRWIRPEDVRIYEELGFESYKMSGRRMSAEWIARAVTAYTERNYKGNLSDIIDYSLVGIENDTCTPDFETMVRGAVDLKSRNYIKLSQFAPKRPYINNKKLDGFLNYFLDKKCTGVCEKCNYCKSFAAEAILNDDADRERQMDFYQQLLEDMVTSSMFL